MKDFVKNNLIVFVFLFEFVALEVLSVLFTGGFPLLTRPWYFLLFVTLVASLLFLLKDKRLQCVAGTFLLGAQGFLAVLMVFLYDSNGTYFDWAMISQRNDARGTVEKWTFNGWLIALCCAFIVFFITFCIVYIYKTKDSRLKKIHIKDKDIKKAIIKARKKQVAKVKYSKATKAILSSSMAICLSAILLVPFFTGLKEQDKSYSDRLYTSSSYSKYQQYGITGNALYEMFNGIISNKVDTKNLSNMEDYLYGDESDEYKLKTSEYFGVSQGNNLVVIMVESMEWFAFLNEWYDESVLREIYPNLYNFMGDSLVLDNFYAREKTDTSEVLSVLGSNPTGKYVHYSFENNTYPYSLPNMFRQSVEDNGNEVKQIKSFHQNQGTFYNRNVAHEAFGFEDLVDIKDMEEFGVQTTWDKYDWKKGEITNDSIAWETMKGEMFPAVEENEQFFTFTVTFAMHGYYDERESFREAGYYDLLDSYNVYPAGLGVKADYLRTYAAAVKDFDVAVGIMMDELETKGLLDNTTIVMFGDHNAYYNNLSYFAKDINEKYNSELYRIPCMIYDQKLFAEMETNGEEPTISKFTTTADIIPTVLDIMGIRGWKNLYFGSSIFTDTESIIYSRAYGIYVTDKLICYSPSNLLYTCSGFTAEDKQDFLDRATIHLNKLEMIDKIYYSDYFKNHTYKNA